MGAQWDAVQEAGSAAKEARNAMEDAQKRLASGFGGFKAADGELEKIADAAFGPSVDRAYAAGRGDDIATDIDTSARGKAVADVVVAVTDKETPLIGREPWDAIERRMADVVRDHLQAAYERGKKDGLTSAQAK
ncbi:hypothetical protein [Paraburkholderia sp.]|uniref:hypothetical protein n=1 Tax=Paraburkholderia sp. TaxID=1926495 RepID=UPI0023865CE4|nr:hypothetical protein [Paraburkholderia sp.]MDE1181502.1 hypothetical protein [Paraburkholderia sp.]